MNFYTIKPIQKIILPKKADNPAITDLLNNYAYGIKWDIEFSDNENEIIIGDVSSICVDDFEYVINTTESGIYIGSNSYKGTIHGFVTLLEMIFCYGKYDYRIKCGILKETPKISFRSVHMCLFPEYSIEKIRKAIRICGIAKYTHIFLETWGSIKLDTLKELAWPHGHEKSEIKKLISEANALGIEVVPFFQHLGHASLARLGYTGKHTILDQNPALEYLYYPESYGWVWNFKNDEVKELLKNVREELMELFGDCEYFHLGCDESGIEFQPTELTDYLNEVSEHLKQNGRRAIIWGDMMLSREFFPGEQYECNSSAEYATALLEKLNKDIIIADWQYNTTSTSWSTSKLLKEKGFDVICCPWDGDENINGAIKTAIDDNLFGIMETTWDRLFENRGVSAILYLGLGAYGDSTFEKYKGHVYYIVERTHTAFRKTAPKLVDYEESGWRKNNVQI